MGAPLLAAYQIGTSLEVLEVVDMKRFRNHRVLEVATQKIQLLLLLLLLCSHFLLILISTLDCLFFYIVYFFAKIFIYYISVFIIFSK